jgi:hypothetical protein
LRSIVTAGRVSQHYTIALRYLGTLGLASVLEDALLALVEEGARTSWSKTSKLHQLDAPDLGHEELSLFEIFVELGLFLVEKFSKRCPPGPAR